jgi:hypothetical protein
LITKLICNQVISCVNYFSEVVGGQYHIYSYPYTLKEYNNITNNFPGGLFDERPFEHEFFLHIDQRINFNSSKTTTE